MYSGVVSDILYCMYTIGADIYIYMYIYIYRQTSLPRCFFKKDSDRNDVNPWDPLFLWDGGILVLTSDGL